MDLLKKLTIKNLKLNKKRTIITIIGIMLSVALITAVVTMYSSMISSLIKFETYEKGDFHAAFYNVPMDKVKELQNNRKIKEVFLTQNIGYAKLENCKNEYKPYAFVKAFTKKSIDNLSVKLVEGRLPENEDEIVIPTHLKTNGRITLNVGDNITLNIGNRVSEGQELSQKNEFIKEKSEEIINAKEKTYKIVGIIERPASNIESYSAPGYTFITFLNDENNVGKSDVYCKYTKEGLKDNIDVTASILEVNKESFRKLEKSDFDSEEDFNKVTDDVSKAKYEYNINSYLIDLETNPLSSSSVGGLGVVVAIVCGIIVFTSIFCIKNSFDISIAEKTKQYGMLKSVGATKKQIRKNVLFEATILGLIGIPLGLILGMIAASILIVISNLFIGDMLTRNLKLVLNFSWVAFAVSIILGIVTIYLSALRSARKASKISPIESIRNSGEIKIKAKKLKTPKIIRKVFGIGGEISYKNLKRNRKKYRTTVISITVSVFVFIALSYFMNLAFSEIKNELNLRDYNLSVSMATKMDEQLKIKIKEATRLGNIKNYTILKYDRCNIENPKYSNEFKDYMNITANNENTILDGYINVKSINNEQYKEYVKKLGLNYEDIKDKAILIDNIKTSQYNKEKNKYVEKTVKVFEYGKNDVIKCKTSDDKEFEIKVGIATDELPFGLDVLSGQFILVSDEIYEKYFSNHNINIYYDSSNPDRLQDDIDILLKGYTYDVYNIAENVRMMENLYILIGIFLYGFIIVITLIGITNVFNTITTNMELRKPEFAMLKSIGMTSKEFNRMIRLETVFMGVKSLLFSIPIGIGLSYLIYNSLESNVKFELPLNAIIISIVVVFLLITCIMKYSMGKINKQNTIETIRNENI